MQQCGLKNVTLSVCEYTKHIWKVCLRYPERSDGTRERRNRSVAVPLCRELQHLPKNSLPPLMPRAANL